MFCPRCSQEQISAEIRYCSRCGLPADVAGVLDNGGFVDRHVVEHTRGLRRSISIGILLMAASFIFFIVSLVLGTPEPSYVVQFNLLVTLVIFLLGLGWAGYSIWRKSNSAKPVQTVQGNAVDGADVVTSQLPHQEMAALPDVYTEPVERALDFEQVPTVTENTTKFLKKESE